MNCPVCGREMEKGGIIAERAVVVAWYPEAEFEKKGLKTMFYRFGKLIGTHHMLRGQVRIPDAWYCRKCEKVTGVFDVTDKLD